jgi:uncharacterized membrane protein YbhN (UPF0104 family)
MAILSKTRIWGLIIVVIILIASIAALNESVAAESFNILQGILNTPVILCLFLLYFLHFVAEPLRWTVYRFGSTEKNHFLTIFSCFNVTALVGYSMPFKLGLPTRLLLLSKYCHINKTDVAKIMLADGIIYMSAWTTVTLIISLLVPNLIHRAIGPEGAAWATPISILFSILASGILVFQRKRIYKMMSSILFKHRVIIILCLFIDILLYGIRHAVIAHSFNIEIEIPIIFCIGILSVFVGMVSTLPLGLGAYDGCLIALLGLYGVGLDSAAMIAIANRLGTILTSIILGIPSALFFIGQEKRL